MENSFTHPSNLQLFYFDFGLAGSGTNERIRGHLLVCEACRNALGDVRRNHPSAKSLKLYVSSDLHFAQSNVVRLHTNSCSYCEQALASYRAHTTTERESVPHTSIKSELADLTVEDLERIDELSARLIIGTPQELFGALSDQLPEDAVDDLNKAGTCLALSLATGAAFHIVQAAKTVVRSRLETMNLTASAGDNKSLRECLSLLREMKESGDSRLNPLLEIRRDPTSNSSPTFTMTEAILLWAACIDAIQCLLEGPATRMGAQPGTQAILRTLQQSA